MLRILLKKQLTEIFRSYFYDAKKNRARSKGATAVYIVLFALVMLGVLGGLFAYLSASICVPLAQAGMDWLYFALMGLLSVLLGAFGSVFNTYAGLYLAKDNDLLLSMPIPVSAIMGARLMGVYLMGLMYSGVAFLPAAIVYWISVSAGTGVVVGTLLLMVLISLFVLTLSCALGWVVAKISLKLKHRSLITVLVSLLFIAAYYFFYFKAQSLIADLVANVALYGERIRGAAYPVYLFGRVGVGDGRAILLVSAVVLALFSLMWALISRSFLKIATSSARTEKRVYRERDVKRRGIATALLWREFARFISSPVYMLNCGLGVLLLPLGGLALLWKGSALMGALTQMFGEQVDGMPLLTAAICLLVSMNDMAAPSVSLEGRSLWLIQSLPVTPWQALRAKVALQVILSGGSALFCLACAAIVCAFTVGELLAAALLLGAFVLFMTLLGLFLGLKMPNVNWTNEITPIKQSACVTIALFAGFAYVALLAVGFVALGGWKLGSVPYACGFAVLTLAMAALLYRWLRRRGCAVFAAL